MREVYAHKSECEDTGNIYHIKCTSFWGRGGGGGTKSTMARYNKNTQFEHTHTHTHIPIYSVPAWGASVV